MSDTTLQRSAEIFPWLTDHWSFFMQRLKQDRLPHALMIEGSAGNGKTTLASVMVARLLCLEDQPQACGQCRSCQLLTGGAHPDYFDIKPDEGSEVIKVDQIRALIGRLDLTTSISARKIAYIRPAECMNPAASNALLKSLEEPVGNAVLILVTNNAGRLPVTIRSRCQSITVNQPAEQLALDWLQKTTGKPQNVVAEVLQAAGGSPLRAISYLDSPGLDAYGQVIEGLARLLGKPASVSMVASKLNDLNPADLWRWLSLCTGEVIKSIMTGRSLGWLPENVALSDKTLLQLQRQADINRQLSTSPVRGDLLLQDWLIRWAEQII
jgi:DNA polymerase-3 subunit delta'